MKKVLIRSMMMLKNPKTMTKILMLMTKTAITHSVVFKCTGILKQHEYQETLALVKRKMREGTVIPVKLEKELL